MVYCIIHVILDFIAQYKCALIFTSIYLPNTDNFVFRSALDEWLQQQQTLLFLFFFFSPAQETNGQIDKKNSYCVYVYVGDVLTIKYEKGNKR
jgi:hypothetical protein